MKQAQLKFKIYTKDSCDFCIRAKHTLDTMDLIFEEVRLEEHPDEKARLKAEGFKTVPQIYYGDDHIGGYTELVDYLNGKEVYTRKSA
jgi:glutaredoxin 3